MKIVVELKDFWMGEDEGFEKGFRDYVVGEVRAQIYDSIKSDVKIKITEKIQAEVDKTLKAQIDKEIKNIIESESIFPNGSSGTPVTLKQYIKDKFQHDSGYWSPLERIGKLAGEFATELKKRYDLVFASQVVAKMNENGLLKEQYAKLLLDEKK